MFILSETVIFDCHVSFRGHVSNKHTKSSQVFLWSASRQSCSSVAFVALMTRGNLWDLRKHRILACPIIPAWKIKKHHQKTVDSPNEYIFFLFTVISLTSSSVPKTNKAFMFPSRKAIWVFHREKPSGAPCSNAFAVACSCFRSQRHRSESTAILIHSPSKEQHRLLMCLRIFLSLIDLCS